MAAAGCMLLEETVARAAMTYHAFAHVGYYLKLIRRIQAYFASNSIDLVVLCDSPSFNFHIAKAAKRAGIATLFYVAPQLWAWAGWRIRKLQRYCDRLACVLPFEEQWFRDRGVPAVFVGNPMLDNLDAPVPLALRDYKDFLPDAARIVLLPGSRRAELQGLWCPMQQIALRLQHKFPSISITTVAVNEQARQLLQGTQIRDFCCEYVTGSVYQTVTRMDFALVASGSVTLQVAAGGCPMVIMYQSSRLLWHLVGRWLVTTPRLSLLNILAGRTMVPEFMPYFGSIDPIVRTCEKLLAEPSELARISAELLRLVEPLAAKNASEQVALLAAEMLTRASSA
jgi:lipid-A-disaccharide synthase